MAVYQEKRLVIKAAEIEFDLAGSESKAADAGGYGVWYFHCQNFNV